MGIIKARKKPNAIAARALANAGVGHKYWSSFPPEIREQIEKLANEIWDGMFTPLLQLPVKTTDLPIAGEGYSATAFRMIFDLINQVNDIAPSMWQVKPPGKKSRKKSDEKKIADDADGSVTVSLMRNVRRAALLISGNYEGSLGLHPLVYFYTREGRIQPAAFLATVKFVMDLKEKRRFYSFTKYRSRFEEYLVQHPDFAGILGHAYGSRSRPVDALVVMYNEIFNCLKRGEADDDKITEALVTNPRLSELQKAFEPKKRLRRKNFSADEKSAAYLNEAITSPVRCYLCNSRIHTRGFNIDHMQAKKDGGNGDVSNAKPTHFYCNGGFRQQMEAIERKKTQGTLVESDEEDPEAKDAG